MVQIPSWVPAPVRVGIPLAVVLSLLLVWRIDRPRGDWGQRLRSRFLLGVPWGTLVSVLGVLAVYLFVQQGWSNWYNPVTLPFSSWSYLYPLGWAFAAFSHGGPGHLVGNLTTTLAVAPLAEYFFGHFAGEKGTNPFARWTTNPWIRAFVVFPAVVVLVGLATSLFAWGPIIGFSGVVFAFVGFALVRYPLLAVVAVSAQEVVRLVYRALRNPVVTGSASPSFGTPWWFGIAVQGHALGLLLGILLGVLVRYRRRDDSGVPSALRVWTGALVLGTSMSLWALWWYRGESTYVLYRGLGVVFVVTLALVVAIAATADRRPLFGDAFDRFDSASDHSPLLGGVTRQQVGAVLVLLPLAAMVGVAIPVNLTTVADADVPGGGPAVEVEGYTVTYAEGVQNGKVSAIDVSAFGESTNVTTSGVIVVNEDRHVWAREVSKGKLAFRGRARVRVGGLGWSEVVRVEREGWSAVDGGTVYQVWVNGPDTDWKRAYASDPAIAGPTIANKSVAIVADHGAFDVHLVQNNSTLASAPMPVAGENVSIGQFTFEREGPKLYALRNGTRVRVAKREQYR